MELKEISARIDYLLKRDSAGIIVDEYVKSLYLTWAQVMFVDQALAAYEYTDALRHILTGLLIESSLTSPTILNDYYSFPTPEGIKSIVYESVNDDIKTIPLDFNDIHKTRPNPFRKPYSELAYRITNSEKLTIFSSMVITKYYFVYCEEPGPIILEAIPAKIAIKGVSIATKSKLPYDSIMKIIDIAVGGIIQQEGIFKQSPSKEK